MKRFLLPMFMIAGLLVLSPVSADAALAAGGSTPSLACESGLGEYCGALQFAQSSCAAAASAVARQMGGEVIGSPQVVQQDGRTMCVVTVLIRDPDGRSPPRRERVTVPAQ